VDKIRPSKKFCGGHKIAADSCAWGVPT